jgi:hypothetical protein
MDEKRIEKTKETVNEWLVDKEYISTLEVNDLIYFEKLCESIHSYLTNISISVYCGWDGTNARLFFIHGYNKRFFDINSNISYFDFIQDVDKWIKLLASLRPNEWLDKKEFMQYITYEDKYYLQILFRHLYSFLKCTPIPVFSSWRDEDHRIYFAIGADKKSFEIDNDISWHDFLYIVENWVKKYYPTYEVESEMEDTLTDDEIWAKVKDEGLKLDDALLIKRKVNKVEKGVITKIHLTDDEFVFRVNDIDYVRLSGTIDNPMSLSSFLKKVRFIDDSKKKKEFIMLNSVELKMIQPSKDLFTIDYSGQKMKNFFIIRYNELKKIPLVKLLDKSYQWCKFKIVFESYSMEEDCIKYLIEKRKEEGIEI